MSREFGSYETGYFHYQMSNATSDCLGGSDELTRLWGKFFAEFEPIAYAIASSEAGDSGPAIEAYVNTYERVAEHAASAAVRKAMDDGAKSED